MGIWDGPPFSMMNPDGTVKGLAPDVINAAAKRLGMRLRWVKPKETPEELLPRGAVDLWSSLSVTPRRQQLFFVTSAWSENNYGLVSLASRRPRPAGNSKGTIGAINSPIAIYMANRVSPLADMMVYEDRPTPVRSALYRRNRPLSAGSAFAGAAYPDPGLRKFLVCRGISAPFPSRSGHGGGSGARGAC